MGKILLRDVSKTYQSEGHDIEAVKGLNLEINDGEIFGLVGTSGCGKTTALNLIAGFIRATSGEVLVDNQKVFGPSRTCGVVFQSDSTFGWLSAADNVKYGLLFNGTPKAGRKELAHKYLELVGLRDFASMWPRELSGGMRKRLEVARALAANPQVLLLDEPFGTLDVMTKEEMQILLLNIWRAEKKTVLFVTHDIEEAVFVSHRVAVMSARPGSVKCIIDIPFDMERQPSFKLTSDFLDLRRRVVSAMAAGNNAFASP